MKLFFVKGEKGYDQENPILVLADNKEEAEAFVKVKSTTKYECFPDIIFEDNSPDEKYKAGEGYELKKGIIWKQFNAG
jgi:hypothetical protein